VDEAGYAGPMAVHRCQTRGGMCSALP
jgi:hypothetical protein